MKGLSILMWPPVIAWFVQSHWRWAIGLVPTFWPMEAFWRSGGIGGDPWPVIGAGLAIHLGLLAWLLRRFRRKRI